MTRTNRRALLALATALALASATWVTARIVGSDSSSAVRTVTSGRPDLVNDPGAPLAVGVHKPEPADSLSWSGMTGTWSADEPLYTFGVFICLQHGGPVDLIAVEPVATVGTDYEPTGAWVYTPGAGEILAISVGGDPNETLKRTTLAPLPNAQFRFKCGNSKPQQQLLVGLRGTGPSGGGWDGIRVLYEADGERHTLEAPIQAFLCGETTISCPPP